MSGSVVDALRWWARTMPDHVAISVLDHDVTYAEAKERADAVALELRSHGVRPGDRVGIVGANSLQWYLAALGAWTVGAIVTPFNQRMVAAELSALVADCRPVAVFCDADHEERLREGIGDRDVRVLSLGGIGHLPAAGSGEVERPDTSPDDACAIIYTSGTTGQPKGVIFTHATIAGVMQEWSLIEPVHPNALNILLVLPLFTAAGTIWGIARSVIHGGRLFLHPSFDPAAAITTLTEHDITVLTGPPIIFEQIAQSPGFDDADLSTLVTAHVGGARVPVDLLTRWQTKGVSLRQIYGQTELGGSVTAMPRDEAVAHLEQCGWGGIFTRLRIVDPDGVDRPVGTPGEIVVRGPGVTPGYWGRPEETARSFRDGWFLTGDLGVLDERGYLTYVDRLKDMIISGGLNISPAEVEGVIGRVPGVREVAVISVPDAKFGETCAAIIAAEESVTAEQVVKHCNGLLADFKVPRYVIFSDGPLPRMASGKIAKKDMRGDYQDAPDRFPRVR